VDRLTVMAAHAQRRVERLRASEPVEDLRAGVERARAGGADGVLLMPALLGPYLPRLEAAARGLGLSPVLS
jgi:hypothetical protein